MNLSFLGPTALLCFLVACGGGDGSPAPETGDASECFNGSLYGTTLVSYRLDYRLSGSRTGTYSFIGSNQKQQPQDPRPLTKLQESEVTQFQGEAAQATVLTNVDYEVNGKEVSVSKRDTVYLDGSVAFPRTLIVYAPPRTDKRFTLAAGASFTLEEQFTRTDWTSEERVASGFTDAGGRTQTGTLSTSIRYIGQEMVSVPAGTFQACRFEESSVDATSTKWYAKGTGLLVRQDTNESGTRRLLDLTSSELSPSPASGQ